MILAGNENIPGIILHSTNTGIVRMDDILDNAPDTLQAALERDAKKVILEPKK